MGAYKLTTEDKHWLPEEHTPVLIVLQPIMISPRVKLILYVLCQLQQRAINIVRMYSLGESKRVGRLLCPAESEPLQRVRNKLVLTIIEGVITSPIAVAIALLKLLVEAQIPDQM